MFLFEVIVMMEGLPQWFLKENLLELGIVEQPWVKNWPVWLSSWFMHLMYAIDFTDEQVNVDWLQRGAIQFVALLDVVFLKMSSKSRTLLWQFILWLLDHLPFGEN